MGTIYKIPLTQVSAIPSFGWTDFNSLSTEQINFINDTYDYGIAFATGTGSDNRTYDNRILSTADNDFLGFVLRSNGYSTGVNFNNSSTHYYISKRVTTDNITQYNLSVTTDSDGIDINSYVQPTSLLPSYADCYSNETDLYNALVGYIHYPITYSSSNSTVSGPSTAAVGDTVTVSAVPDAGYGITDASTQILVTNNDVAVPYTWDAATNHITFTMPDPS